MSENRAQIDPKMAPNRARGALRALLGNTGPLGAVQRRSRTLPERPLDAPEAPWTTHSASRRRPGASQSASEAPPTGTEGRSELVLRGVLAHTRLRSRFRTIFYNFCIADGPSNMRFDCAIRSRNACCAISAASPTRAPERAKNDRKSSEKRPQIGPRSIQNGRCDAFGRRNSQR